MCLTGETTECFVIHSLILILLFDIYNLQHEGKLNVPKEGIHSESRNTG